MPFNFRVKDNEQIVGFKGRNGWYLDGIGFHISRAPKRKLSRKVEDSLVTTSELYGGVRGRVPWDDGIYDGVREITLVYGQCIDSICFAYDQDGKLVKTGKHGGFGGNHLHNNLSTVEVSFKLSSYRKIRDIKYQSLFSWSKLSRTYRYLILDISGNTCYLIPAPTPTPLFLNNFFH